MQYLIANLWKLPELTRHTEGCNEAPTSEGDHLMAAACRDCGQYNFPPKAQCRYCGSPRIRTVQLSGDVKPNPGTWVFGATADDPTEKPN
ncbi:hypothetical protein FIV42_24640 [Persicimonas caeni]|uniref:ChsH2 rubredoxin-like zinc ribbon domain-containing protein n=1 Tax=Persicimonas caeni TaxID=2292766 RepID=A0A4Y6Q1F2_PERCE|nr:hypothetical protein FIV42_24640 [Persicimonas caeni]QED35036.1 hypothetical protein FRD00_24635 [Persicimonas caeni]